MSSSAGRFLMALKRFYPSWCLPSPPQSSTAPARVSSDNHTVTLLLPCTTSWGVGGGEVTGSGMESVSVFDGRVGGCRGDKRG